MLASIGLGSEPRATSTASEGGRTWQGQDLNIGEHGVTRARAAVMHVCASTPPLTQHGMDVRCLAATTSERAFRGSRGEGGRLPLSGGIGGQRPQRCWVERRRFDLGRVPG